MKILAEWPTVSAAMSRRVGVLLVVTVLMLAGCGGGGGGSDSPPPSPPVTPPPSTPTVVVPELPASGTALALAGSADDPITKGKSFSYTQASARLSVTTSGALVQIEVMGDERLSVDLVMPVAATDLKPGVYRDLPSIFTAQSLSGRFSVRSSQPQAFCVGASSDVTVDSVSFDAGRVLELTMTFEHRCEGSATALSRGRLRWQAGDASPAPGPLAVPADLWQPAAGVLPAGGNYIYLESQAGDPVGEGGTLLHTQADTWIYAEPAGPRIHFIVRGERYWFGTVYAMDSLARLQPGYYTGLQSGTWRNPRRGAFSWVADLERCLEDTRSWMAIDSVSYRGEVLSAIELRFEQRCAGGTAPPLRGKIRWSSDDATRPPGPQAVPAGLWSPPAAALPATGNYVYLESEPGEWIGGGQTSLITPDQMPLNLYASGGKLTVTLGNWPVQGWQGFLQGDYTQSRLERGLYAGLLDINQRNPARGGIGWFSLGRGCTASGWFAVDDIRYTRGVLRSVDLRFEQICKPGDKALRGKIHWVTTDPVLLADDVVDGPLLPAPAPASIEPPTDGRSYVQLDSGADDFVGAWGRYLYTQADSRLSVSLDILSGHRLHVAVVGNEQWSAEFSAVDVPPGSPNPGPPAPGTYLVPLRERVDDPGPRMDVNGEARGCDYTHGSFTIERISVAGGAVQALDLSFEQYCEAAYLPLRGRVHWVADDPTQPPAPIWPIPDGLWRLPEALVPSSGNYLFVHSPTGEFVGGGVNHLFAGPESTFILFANQAEPVNVRISSPSESSWGLYLGPPYNATQLVPGLYPFATRAAAGNPAFGRMAIYSGRGCNELSGWFAVDAVAYEGNTLTWLEVRFEQYCENEGPPLKGQMRWRR
jgi:hypothetical protein